MLLLLFKDAVPSGDGAREALVPVTHAGSAASHSVHPLARSAVDALAMVHPSRAVLRCRLDCGVLQILVRLHGNDGTGRERRESHVECRRKSLLLGASFCVTSQLRSVARASTRPSRHRLFPRHRGTRASGRPPWVNLRRHGRFRRTNAYRRPQCRLVACRPDPFAQLPLAARGRGPGLALKFGETQADDIVLRRHDSVVSVPPMLLFPLVERQRLLAVEQVNEQP
jgi:hypothetical protein